MNPIAFDVNPIEGLFVSVPDWTFSQFVLGG
jgi:hypothetical protein